MSAIDSEITAALGAMRLLPDGPLTVEPLAGGVSCDVFKVQTASRTLVVKRALPKLRVAAYWCAPAERSHAEVAWMRLVGGVDPGLVPRVLGEDRARHIFAMTYLSPETHPVWKGELAAGRCDAEFAAKVGAALARIHGETAGRSDIARRFANAAQFHALRIEAYLLFTAARHDDVAPILRGLARNLSAARTALMHGDISPKNILVGPSGPVFLDAETCTIGDPAFDLAFCLNHLLLKAVWHRRFAAGYAACFEALTEAYFAGAIWESRHGLERRTAALLPGLLLARIDGKSPVEYLTRKADKAFVRAHAKAFLADPPARLDIVLERWVESLSRR